MASRYVPPALRNKTQDDAQNAGPAKNNLQGEPLARRRLSDLKISNHDEKQLYTLYELNKHYGSSLVHSTLRDTSSKPNQLGYLVLFRGANPRWATDHIIFAHTNIHILPGYQEFKLKSEPQAIVSTKNQITDPDQEWEMVNKEDVVLDEVQLSNSANDNKSASGVTVTRAISPSRDSTTDLSKGEDTLPVPVFIELGNRGMARKFAYHGYFRLDRVDFLLPHSPELVRMLQQKWGESDRDPKAFPSRVRKRDPEAWAKSLGQEWAVVQFTTIPENEIPDEPKIKVVHEDEIEKDMPS